MRQAELARRCDISASYLNLIEHNKRRIGGALINKLARALDVDPALLSEGAETSLTAGIEAAAARHSDVATESAEELAGRYPGWARLIEAQSRETERLERVVQGLNDRLTHDPFLSASLHDVLSSVTAIRSASSILADGTDIAPEWQARFHRNILEDSRRLTGSAEQLVSYLDAGADVEQGMKLPQEELEAWLEKRSWAIPELEEEPDANLPTLLADFETESSISGAFLAKRHFEQYASDAKAVPAAPLVDAIDDVGPDPARLAQKFNVSLTVIFRRLASLKAQDFPDQHARGLVACDGSGTLTFRKNVPGFEFPRFGAACPLWPLFVALQRPTQPIRQSLHTSGHHDAYFTSWALSEVNASGGFDGPSIVTAWMLVAPSDAPPENMVPMPVGTSCRICVQPDCPARREPPLVATQRAAIPTSPN